MTALPCPQAPPLQADSFGLLAAPVAVLLPELRRKERSAKLKAKAEKTSAVVHFDCPGMKHSRRTSKQNFPGKIYHCPE
jgi:hypothetical protein